MKTKIFSIILLFCPLSGFCQNNTLLNDTSISIEERVDDLVSKMTLEEKISQMVHTSPAIERLGIPEYNWWNEALHGIARNGIATVFPQAIGMAAAWDKDLILRAATVISDEARAKYNKAVSLNRRGIYQGITLWSPNINIFRDPRWGRGMETYGEDPFLTGEIGLQFVKGLQGDDPKYLKTISTPKHLVVHSGPEPLRHTFNAVVSEYDLRETYLPHFKKCVMEGKAYSVMCAYNRFRGDACCGSDPLIKDILRGEWNFEGLMVSDCWAVPDMYNFHKIVDTPEEAASIAVKSGTDLECGNSYPSLLSAVRQGLISEEELDVSVRRIFTARFKLGMFDPPEMVPFSKLDKYDTPENKEVALEAARKSIVLLKNDKNTLPLTKSIKTISVIGPNADDIEVLLGNYNGFPSSPVTPLQGIKDKLPGTEIFYEPGCDLAEGMPSFMIISEDYIYTSPDKTQHGFKSEYFSNPELTGEPEFTRIDSKIDFAWWDGSPGGNLDPFNFGVRWTGVIIPPKSGLYYLGGYGFNCFKIYFEDSLAVSFNGEHEPSKVYKPFYLTADRPYKIRVELNQSSRYSFMQLIWNVPDDDKLRRAVEAAEKSDAVIMFMGLSPRLEGEEMKVEIEGFKGGDRTSLDLPAVQAELIRKIHAANKPVILVLLNGSALALNWEHENLGAIIEAWYPGQAAGTAIADVIFGDYNPAGRLPVTYYKSVEQLPEFTDYNMDNRTYRYFKGDPLYHFGYGLSYTEFEYTDLKLSSGEISAGDTVLLSVDVANTGKFTGDEVVQLYVKADKDFKTIKTLKGFDRITLNPGEKKTVKFSITPELLSRWIDGKGSSVEKDTYNLMVGSSSMQKDLIDIRLTVK